MGLCCSCGRRTVGLATRRRMKNRYCHCASITTFLPADKIKKQTHCIEMHTENIRLNITKRTDVNQIVQGSKDRCLPQSAVSSDKHSRQLAVNSNSHQRRRLITSNIHRCWNGFTLNFPKINRGQVYTFPPDCPFAFRHVNHSPHPALHLQSHFLFSNHTCRSRLHRSLIQSAGDSFSVCFLVLLAHVRLSLPPGRSQGYRLLSINAGVRLIYGPMQRSNCALHKCWFLVRLTCWVKGRLSDAFLSSFCGFKGQK